MSRAEELLSTLSNDAGETRLIVESIEPHIIIGNDRYITVPDALKRLAVQYDHDIETVTFDCPRYWDGRDMSEMSIYINYLRPDAESGVYKAENVVVDTNNSSIMHFNWTISRNVTEVSGAIVFLVCIKKTDAEGNEKNHWNSELCKTCRISEGLEIDGQALKEMYPDIIEQWYNEVLGVIDEVNEVKQNLIVMRDSGEFDGATFTPSVSSTGDLSWTNDGGRENPATVNVRGPDGVSPTIQVTDIQGGHRITITDVNGSRHVDVMDTILDADETVTRLLNDFVYVGEVEPTSLPVLWFDTSEGTDNGALITYKDSSGTTKSVYPITRKNNVNGLDEAIRDQSVTTAGDGSAYTATVDGITALTSGVSFVMKPHVESSVVTPTLNVNGLGAKYIRRRVSSSTGTTTSGLTSDWLTANKPIVVTYDGTFWIADLPRPNASDIMGAVSIQNGGTGATTAAQARVNLGVETQDGTVSSGNADYAEVGEWSDGNTSNEDRIGYFVCVDLDNPGIIMKKATSTDDVRGVTVSAPAFSGGCSEDKFDSEGNLRPAYNYVAVMGIVPVIDNGTCTIGGRCMPSSDSTAAPVSGEYGYQVMERVDDTHVLIAVEPGVDFQYKLSQSALFKAGGAMEGSISMGGNKVTGLGDPMDASDATTKSYVDSKHIIKTSTITTAWLGSSAPYTQDVNVSDILDTDYPHISPVYSSNLSTAKSQKEAWSMVGQAVTRLGVITFTCFEEKPTVEVPIQIEVMR